MRLRIKNKKRFAIILSIVLVLLAMISGTYSLYYHESIAQSSEDYTTGMLSIVAKSKSDNINLTNALPMTDEEGALTEPYVFNIENVGNLDYNFKIRLLSTSENPINPAYIKLKIDDGEVTTLSALTNSIIKSDITLKAKENIDVTIRIWLASNTPNTEIGKSFNSRIVTEGQAVYTEENKTMNLSEYITTLYNESRDLKVTNNGLEYQYATSANLMNDRLGDPNVDINGGNIRFYGEDPHNYVYFGERLSNPSWNRGIYWKILGIFDGEIRLITPGSIGDFSFDTSASDVNNGKGFNQWGPSGEYQGSDLMKLLNPGYEENEDLDANGNTIRVNNSLWWNGQSGKCYNGLKNTTTTCNFTNYNTILPDEIKNRIVDQTLYTGYIPKSKATFADVVYRQERSGYAYHSSSPTYNSIVGTSTSSWTGKVGIMLLSDYAYATDFTDCSENLKNDCQSSKNWIWRNRGTTRFLYTITPIDDNINDTFVIDTGKLAASSYMVGNKFGILPVITLPADTHFEWGGDGTYYNPYVIKYD